ncbi:MAG: F0F1 ATP synthase subunit delta [Gammaproteobacteria bacterium]|nr:F0F1 ATP synthase subunit delta [Gammaproteobacteria bacterium]
MAEKSTIARPYAQAVFELAKASGDYTPWTRLLQRAARVVVDPALSKYIDNPLVSKDTLAALLLEVLAEQLIPQGKSFLQVLVENKRLAVVPEIAVIFEQLRADAERRIDAEVISAFPLSPAQQQVISAGLKKRLGREVNLVAKVDAALIGGAVVRAGDMVIDGSVTGQLEKLAYALAH